MVLVVALMKVTAVAVVLLMVVMEVVMISGE